MILAFTKAEQVAQMNQVLKNLAMVFKFLKLSYRQEEGM
jgi:hypothetical protein